MMKEAELKDLINVSRSREFSLQKAQRIVCCANLFLFDYNMILFWIISVKVYFSFCLTKFNGCFFDSSPKYPTFSRLYFISQFWYWLKKKPGKLQICILIEKSIFVYKSLHVYRYILQKLCSEYQLTVYVCFYLTEALFWVSVDSPSSPVHPLHQQWRCQRHFGMAENKRRAKWSGNINRQFGHNYHSATCDFGERVRGIEFV